MIKFDWRVRKTDRRMTGHQYFQYVANPSYNKIDFIGLANKPIIYRNMLFEARNWCWQTWGPSCELGLFRENELFDTMTDRWCWQTEFNNFKILLKSDKEANWFKLKWQ